MSVKKISLGLITLFIGRTEPFILHNNDIFDSLSILFIQQIINGNRLPYKQKHFRDANIHDESP